MVDFLCHQACQEPKGASPSRLSRVVWVLLIVSEERSYVWSGLADDEMVDVEELCEAGERRFTLIEGVAGCLPVLECDLTLGRGYGEPRDNSTSFVLAEEGIWAVVNCS